MSPVTAPIEHGLTNYKVLVFDVYGTLADWETGIFNALKPVLEKYSASQKWSRRDVLTAYAGVERDLQVQYPEMLYSDILAKISEVLEARLKAQSDAEGNSSTLDGSVTTSTGIASNTAVPSTSAAGETTTSPTTRGPHVEFGQSIQHWPIFPDSSMALHLLAKDYKLIVLSNVDNDSFRYTHAKLSLDSPAADAKELATYSNPNSVSTTSITSAAEAVPEDTYANYWHPRQTPGSRSPFSLAVTAQDVKCYKPALGGFRKVLECVRTDPELLGDLDLNEDEVKKKVLVVAQSLSHDHEAAHQLGLKSVWIDRQGAVTCRDPPQGVQRWTWRFETLEGMAKAVASEKQANQV